MSNSEPRRYAKEEQQCPRSISQAAGRIYDLDAPGHPNYSLNRLLLRLGPRFHILVLEP
jgi:hypothetical protein